MPELQFKGKEFVFNHHLTVPFRPLIPDGAKSIGEPSLGGNLIIHGDNLQALKALLPMYAGKVDCVYIDPPYNTGNRDWVYKDDLSNAMFQAWRDDVDTALTLDDLLRHDKWCSMMWPRLMLLKELLEKSGSIFISIDDNEIHRLRLMMDEIFGDSCFAAQITVLCNPKGRGLSEGSRTHTNMCWFIREARMEMTSRMPSRMNYLPRNIGLRLRMAQIPINGTAKYSQGIWQAQSPQAMVSLVCRTGLDARVGGTERWSN